MLLVWSIFVCTVWVPSRNMGILDWTKFGSAWLFFVLCEY